MRTVILVLLSSLVVLAQAPGRKYTLEGQIMPEAPASISLHGSTTPFSDSGISDSRGRFRFRNLLAGTYTAAAFLPGRGEARQTIVVGPSQADSKGRVRVTLEIRESRIVRDELRRRGTVSVKQLSIPDKARREYAEAQKKLSRRDVEGAVAALEKAVKIAPQFTAAWNNLGTIAYQTGQYPLAESHFREALEQDPTAYEPLVNLGGVLLNLGKPEEARSYNSHAVLARPNDALANAQLGMNYFALNDLPQAEKYLKAAIELDPAHFSYPQLTLGRVLLKQRRRQEARRQFEDFLSRHPDSPHAGQVKALLSRMR